MNEQNFEEQPKEVETLQEDNIQRSSDDEKEVEEITSEAERGVPVGKFKSVEDLEKAYNSLQSEFTRKCQRLAELEKDKMSKESVEDKFDANFKTFLLENQEAFSYADEIKNTVRSDESLKNDEKAFDKVQHSFMIKTLHKESKERT